MYNKNTTEKVSISSKPGSVVLTDSSNIIKPDTLKIMTGNPSEDALVANCDGCGSQIWISGDFKDLGPNHLTYCHNNL